MAASIPAATLVLIRDSEKGPPELLVVERAGDMAFAAGALVFPGGRIDPEDHGVAADPALVRHAGPLDPDDAAARVAAIRETIEESGIAPALVLPPDHDALARFRARLHAGEDFGALLAEHGWALDLDTLVPFARWCPNFRETRTFDTRFYVARAPADAPQAIVDATENVRSFWASAADILSTCDRGEARVIFPTRRNLERLAAHACFADAEADARAVPIETITPWVEQRDGGAFVCIPEGLGYPVTFEPLETARRA